MREANMDIRCVNRVDGHLHFDGFYSPIRQFTCLEDRVHCTRERACYADDTAIRRRMKIDSIRSRKEKYQKRF